MGTTYTKMTTLGRNRETPIHVIKCEIYPNHRGKIFQPALEINADAKVGLRQLINRVERDGLGRSTDPAKLDSIATSKKEWFDYHAELCSDGGSEGKINQYYVIDKLSETFPNGTDRKSVV